MDYLKYIETEASVTEAAPLVTPLIITRGRLIGGFVYFPAGPAGKLHLIARIGNHQILPFNTGESYRLDNAVVPFSLNPAILERPCTIELVTWNDSTDYTHALTVCLFVEELGK